MTKLKNFLVKLSSPLLGLIFLILLISSIYGYFTLHRSKLDESRELHLEQLAQATRSLLRDSPEIISSWPKEFIQGQVLEQVYCQTLNRELPVNDVSKDYQNYLGFLPYDLRVEDPLVSYYYFKKENGSLILGSCLTEFADQITEVVHLN